ncbi:helix-turn-helix domain-containing protein [Mycobacterium szulgai]|uniref:PucR family transcriptional regulator n=1 Tax=Mycobacterium szulgai TaxID=1787 RepID=A0A1X2F2Y3_MYCSZ|nr:helix-turn-helix domain-containing protein [Mycobacterium szulgai]MCV7075642.1 helix-turn-helix domain-containing protein [Mycobacterium szulgai]ORX12765.1 PucR family transcriptional regulator [Mycobacterium szulgai]
MAAPITPFPEPSINASEVTIRRLLDEVLMAGARVVSGADQLDREVTSILPLTEAPSLPNRLDAVAVYARVEALADSGILLAALVSRGLGVVLVDGPIPAELLHSGLPAGLVVVELPSRVGFAALSRLFAKLTLDEELQQMRYSMHVQAMLAKLFHRGAGLEILIREVCNLGRNPAMVLDDRGRVLAHVGLNANELDAITNSVRRVLATGGRTARRSTTQSSRVDRVAGANGGAWTSIAHEIKLGKASGGWVIVLAPFAILNVQDLDRHRVLTEQAAAVVGLELLRQRSVEEAEERARDDFIQALLHGAFFSDHELRARAEHHEIDPDSPFGVFVARGLSGQAGGNRATRMLRLARYAAGVATDQAVPADATVIGDLLVVIRPLHAADEPTLSREMAVFAQTMSNALELRCGTAVAVAYGHPAQDATEVSDRYHEAKIALDVANQLGRTCATSYQEMRSFTMLAGISDTESSRQLIEQFVEPLRSGPNLLGTLTSYLAQGGNVTEAARALNVHRNTLLTKLDRISRAIGLDIREPENQFTACLAIRLDTLATGNRQRVGCPA